LQRNKKIIWLIAFCFWLFFSYGVSESSSLSSKISSRLTSILKGKNPQQRIKIWVFFTDKGIFSPEEYRRALLRSRESLSERALRRRLKVRSLGEVVDFTDLPVYSGYIEKVKQLGAKHLSTTRWLNGICVEISGERIEAIARFPFVQKLEPVARYTRKKEERIYPSLAPGAFFEYGNSEAQVQQLNIPALHEMGYHGSGILIAMLDTGFERSHRSLRKVQVVAEHDFISNDDNTGYDPEHDTIDMRDSHQIDHGTSMLSLIAGYAPGQLIGPAFGADFALARTEWYNGGGLDIKAEEHWWVAGAEWADSLGADIISSSLGYQDFSDSAGYSFSDMDGHTAVTSQWASMAASKGILLVNAVGNRSQYINFIVAPADADSILAIGGVDQEGSWVSSSLNGPTYDGRRKPELVGPWYAYKAYPARPDEPDSFYSFNWGQGTSNATAIVAGGCALLLEAHPDWTPMQVRDALLSTASSSSTPNDTLGWGIPNFKKAYEKSPPQVRPYSKDELLDCYPNPFDPSRHSKVWIPYQLAKESEVSLFIFTISGELVKKIPLGQKMPGRYKDRSGFWAEAFWDGKNERGEPVASGIYLCLLTTGWESSVKKIALRR